MQKVIFILFTSLSIIFSSDIFINEVDYDQPGSDNAEFFELAGLAGTYNNVTVDFLNGNNGDIYNTVNIGS